MWRLSLTDPCDSFLFGRRQSVRGCLLRLALYLPILTLFLILFSIREPFPTLMFNPEAEGIALAPVAVFFFWFSILYLLDARRARVDLSTARAVLGRRL
ncbi:MAG: hypothetical protein PHI99_00315 [Syntrophales bacterium]|nr:hypothetical protein [Syntrophales bacterium]